MGQQVECIFYPAASGNTLPPKPRGASLNLCSFQSAPKSGIMSFLHSCWKHLQSSTLCHKISLGGHSNLQELLEAWYIMYITMKHEAWAKGVLSQNNPRPHKFQLFHLTFTNCPLGVKNSSSTLHALTYWILTSILWWWYYYYSLFYRWGNPGTEKLCNLSKITQLFSGRAKIHGHSHYIIFLYLHFYLSWLWDID